MKKVLLFIFTFFICIGATCQVTKTQKIEALTDLQNTEARMSTMTANLINELLKTADSFDSAFWEEYKAKAATNYCDSIKPQIISIYNKYFTDEEINYMYEFYSSEIGKQTLKKYDLVMQELLLMGLAYSEKISDQILNELEQKEKAEIDYKMNHAFEGCSSFKTGKYTYTLNDSVTLIYERDEKHQTETFGQGKSVFEINWINDCRYSLTLIETNNPYDQSFIGTTTIVNIYEINKDSYKYYYKLENSDEVYEGKMTKVE
jgi:hypothetical protein